MSATRKTFSPSELGRLTGLSPDTVRHYERLGILPPAPRTASGYRRYSADALQRVTLVQSALKLGFSLRELSEVFRLRDSGGAPCQRVFKMAEQKLRETMTQITELRRTERHLRQLLRSWQATLARTAPGQRANLLHSLPATGALPRSGAPRRWRASRGSGL